MTDIFIPFETWKMKRPVYLVPWFSGLQMSSERENPLFIFYIGKSAQECKNVCERQKLSNVHEGKNISMNLMAEFLSFEIIFSPLSKVFSFPKMNSCDRLNSNFES